MEIKLPELSKQFRRLGNVAAVVFSITAIAGGYVFYKNNIWHPTVHVIDVDWSNEVARVMIGKKETTLYGNSTLFAGGAWGVRFGFTNGSATRIELVQDGIVRNTLTTNQNTA